MTDASSIPSARRLGKTDLVVSPMAWGLWRFAGEDLNAATARVEAALGAGLNFLDTADIYGPGDGGAASRGEPLP